VQEREGNDDLQTGIYATPTTRAPKDMRGLTFPVEFEIIDRLLSPEELASNAQAAGKSEAVEFQKPNAPYQVKVLLTVRGFPRPLQPLMIIVVLARSTLFKVSRLGGTSEAALWCRVSTRHR
jgi:hypothetical protein